MARTGAPTPLKRLLFERRVTVTKLSKHTGIHRTRLSDIVNGRGLPTNIESKRITRRLRATKAELGWEDEAA